MFNALKPAAACFLVLVCAALLGCRRADDARSQAVGDGTSRAQSASPGGAKPDPATNSVANRPEDGSEQVAQQKYDPEAENRAVAFVENLNGKVTRQERKDKSGKELSGRPVIIVDLKKTEVADADLKQLARFTHLRMLYLSETPVTDEGARELRGCKELHTLDLSDTKVTDTGLRQVAALTTLSDLQLYKTNVTDAGLKHLRALKNLRRLDLSTTKVTDAGLEELAKCERLLVVGLHFTKVTDEGVARLKKALPNLIQVAR